MNPDELKDAVILIRNVELSYDLDQYTNEALVGIQNAVDQAKRESLNYIKNASPNVVWSRNRAYEIVGEMDSMTAGVQQKLTGMIADISSFTGIKAIQGQNSILSFDGKVPGFNFVKLSKEQLREYILTTPVGGRLLNQPTKSSTMGWIDRTFNVELQRKIQQEITTGALKGEGIAQLAKRLDDGFEMTKKEVTTLTRTYVHSANVNAMDRVYNANSDLIKGVRWTSVLETGYKGSGRGTCIKCAALDGNVYKI